MKCSNCGREIADDSKFCEFCGAKMPGGDGKGGGKMWILWTVIFVLLAAILVNVAVHINKKSEKEPSEKEPLVMEQDSTESVKLAGEFEDEKNSFDFCVQHIVIDREEREGGQNWVISSLKALQKMEKIENDPKYNKPANDTSFAYRGNLYVEKLKEARKNIIDKYKNHWEKDPEAPLYKMYLKRKQLIDEILRQTDGKSFVNVKIGMSPEGTEEYSGK